MNTPDNTRHPVPEPLKPERFDPEQNPRSASEWQRQESARRGQGDALYRAIAEAAALPIAASLPPDFARKVRARARRSGPEDRFEVGLLSLVLCLGAGLALYYALPLLGELAPMFQLSLPQAGESIAGWTLAGAAGLGLAALLSGWLERWHDSGQRGAH
jgi:hypothetical protein